MFGMLTSAKISRVFEGNNSLGTQNPLCTKGRPRQQRGCISSGLIYSLIGTSHVDKMMEPLGEVRVHRSFASMEGLFYFLLLLAMSSCVCSVWQASRPPHSKQTFSEFSC